MGDWPYEHDEVGEPIVNTIFNALTDATLAARLRLTMLHPRSFTRIEREDLLREAAYRLEHGTMRERDAKRVTEARKRGELPKEDTGPRGGVSAYDPYDERTGGVSAFDQGDDD